MASGEANKTATASHKRDAEPTAASPLAKLPPARRSIRLDRIDATNRLRPIDPDAVADLIVSVGEQGMNAPVLIRPVRMDGDDVWYKLVTGGHRYAVAQALGWANIDATIRELTDAQARLVEVDENLVRKGLTAYERALFIEVRLKAWAEVHPSRVIGNGQAVAELTAPKRGRPKNSDKLSQFIGDTPPTMGFAADTASDLGFSARTVERALGIVRGLSKASHAKISGTKLGKNEGLLRQIAGVADPAEQLKVVEALSDGRAKGFGDAIVIASGRTPMKVPERPLDVSMKAFQKAWKGAPPSHRKAMLNWLAGEKLPGFTLSSKAAAE